MTAYIIRRLLLMVPTLLGIMLVSFVVVQFAPGGPVERVIAQISGADTGASSRISGVARAAISARAAAGRRRSSMPRAPNIAARRGSIPEFIKSLEKQFGFDKPAHERFLLMLWNYPRFDFGKSYFRDVSVLELIKEKLPVSISLGIWMTLLTYLISIPLGIRKAVQDGSPFRHLDLGRRHRRLCDPGLPVRDPAHRAVRRRLVLRLFPLRGLTSDNWALTAVVQQDRRLFLAPDAADRLDGAGAFATMTLLTKNSFLDEIRKQYVLTARAKGCTERQVLYGHIFRNAMLIVIAGFPGAFVHAFFSGSLLIETIFSLDGLGLLGFESVLNRDYPVVFATLYIFSLVGLVVNLISDLTYTWVDPRIDFETPGGVMDDRDLQASRRDTHGAAAGRTAVRRRSGGSRSRRSTSGAGRISRPTGAATGRSGFSWCCSSSRCSRNSSPTTSRSSCGIDGKWYFPVFITYSETTFGGDFETAADYRDPYLQKADRGEGRQHGLAADPLFLQHAQSRPADAGAVEADLDADGGAVQGGRREQGPHRLPRSRIQLARHRRPGPRRAWRG